MSLINKFIFSIIEKRLKSAYSNKFKQFGISPKSVFWKNGFTQDLRLELIIKVLLEFNSLNNNIISDVGCGYGRLLEKLICHKLLDLNMYYGIDINQDFIKFCQSKFKGKNIIFKKAITPPCDVDYTIMSGTYNLCTLDNIEIWEKYLCSCLSRNWRKTKKAMIFNLLEKNLRVISGGLYYSNKNWIKNYCEVNFGETKITKSNLLPNDILILVRR